MKTRAGDGLNDLFIICFIHTTVQISSVEHVQRLKPQARPRVPSLVNTINPRKEAMIHASSRRFVKVAPPTIHAGVGNALREAFAMDGELHSLKVFEDLLARLND